MRLIVAWLSLLAGCGGSETAPADAGGSGDAAVAASAVVGPEERPARLVLPFEAEEPMPLVVLLHGYSVSAQVQDAYLRTTPRARRLGFALLLPDGTVDPSGNRFWNALPGFRGIESDVDDVGYLLGLIDEVVAGWAVDPARVYLLGHSNGAFMAYRLACEASERIAAIGSLAGSSSDDPSWCVPSEPVSVLQIHGDADDTILYEGEAGYASATDITARWAEYAGCATPPVAAGALDFDSSLDGAETEVLGYAGCAGDVAVELWTIRGGAHLPAVSDEGIDRALGWLLDR